MRDCLFRHVALGVSGECDVAHQMRGLPPPERLGVIISG